MLQKGRIATNTLTNTHWKFKYGVFDTTLVYYRHESKPQEETKTQMATIHKAKDNSLKIVLGNHELFAEFLRDFVQINMLQNVTSSDIEDITERFLPLFTDQKDSDTVKRVKIDGEEPFFIISIIEHESEVNFRASFKMLQYIALVLNDYEKEVNGPDGMVSYTKDFKYPPVLPIVFYDGTGKWTAETNFLNRTVMSEVFEKYIPKFEYELVNLNEYSVSDLMRFGDALSLIMIIDKIKKPEDMNMLGDLPLDYIERLKLNIPPGLKKLLMDVITVLLTKINVPQEEINDIVDRIEQRGISEMFAIVGYDVQETRRAAREEGKSEGKAEGIVEGKAEGKAEGIVEGKAEGIIEGKAEGIIEGIIEGKIEAAVNMIKNMEISVTEAMRILEIPKKEKNKLIKELKKRNIEYTLD